MKKNKEGITDDVMDAIIVEDEMDEEEKRIMREFGSDNINEVFNVAKMLKDRIIVTPF